LPSLVCDSMLRKTERRWNASGGSGVCGTGRGRGSWFGAVEAVDESNGRVVRLRGRDHRRRRIGTRIRGWPYLMMPRLVNLGYATLESFGVNQRLMLS
jgi:hypothetical protein